jgi:hypothetical protein
MNYEEEDELIEEIDVYYNGELSEEIFVLQYPLRPSDKPYGEHAELSSVHMNKDSSTNNIKLTYSIENKKNFDTQYYENKNFTQSLIGQSIDPNTNYCLGVFKNNILYLNPVSNFVQFRNDFSHMEAAEAAKKKNKEKPVIPPVASRRDSAITLTSNNPTQTEFNDSKWTNFKFYKKDTIQSYQVYEKLYFDDNIKPSKLDFSSHKDYFDLFFSNCNKEIILDKSTIERTFSYTELMEQPLPIRVEFFLKKLSLVNFHTLKKFCGAENIKDETFLDIALKFSHILKNKNLILKSEIRYDPNIKSDMCTKRNYVINLLQNSKEGVRRSEIKFLDQHEANEILLEIAQCHGGVYFLKDGDIYNFGSTNPKTINTGNFKSLFDKEVQFWDSINFKKNPNQPSHIIANINDDSKISKEKSGTSLHRDDQMVVDEDNSNLRQRKESSVGDNTSNNIQGDSISQNQSSSITSTKFNLDIIRNTIKNIFNSKVDCLYYENLLSQIFSQLKLDKETQENQELQSIISDLVKDLCYNINDIIYFKDIGEGDAMIARRTLIEFLASRKTAKKAEIKNHLQSQGISVPDNLLNKILKTIGNYAGTLWSLKEPSA